MRLLVAILALCMVAACSSGGSGGRRGPDYEPVPDDVLFDRAARVDGVEDITLSYNDNPGDRGYTGDVYLASGLTRPAAGNAVATVYAILRQGRYNAGIVLALFESGRPLDPADLPGVPVVGSPDLLLETFGPQPGDGTPPPR